MFSIQIIVDKLVYVLFKCSCFPSSYLKVSCVLTHDIFESQITNSDFAILMQKLLL